MVCIHEDAGSLSSVSLYCPLVVFSSWSSCENVPKVHGGSLWQRSPNEYRKVAERQHLVHLPRGTCAEMT